MYFSEAFLSEASIGDFSLEGENLVFVSKKIVAIIEKFLVEKDINDLKFMHLKEFSKNLNNGIKICEEIYNLSASHNLNSNPEEMILKAQNIQTTVLGIISVEKIVIIPTGWDGHAIALIINLNYESNDVSYYDKDFKIIIKLKTLTGFIHPCLEFGLNLKKFLGKHYLMSIRLGCFVPWLRSIKVLFLME